MAVGKRSAAHGLLAARLTAAKKARNLSKRASGAVDPTVAAPTRLADGLDSDDEEELSEVLSRRANVSMHLNVIFLPSQS